MILTPNLSEGGVLDPKSLCEKRFTRENKCFKIKKIMKNFPPVLFCLPDKNKNNN